MHGLCYSIGTEGGAKTLPVQKKEVLFMRKNFSQMTDEEKKRLFLEMAKKFGGVD